MPKEIPHFKLGQILTDPISGFSGTAVVRIKYDNGALQYILSGKDKDGKIPYHGFDAVRLVAAEGEPSVAQETVTEWPAEIKLGMLAQDIRTGTVGYLDAMEEHLDGCNRVKLKLLGKEGKIPEDYHLSVNHIVPFKEKEPIKVILPPKPADRPPATGNISVETFDPCER